MTAIGRSRGEPCFSMASGSAVSSGTLVLPRGAPLEAARAFVRDCFARDAVTGLVCHRGEFFEWNGTLYKKIGLRNLTSRVYEFLDAACVTRADGSLEPYNPTRHKVREVLDALAAGINKDEHQDVPFWFPSAEGGPPGEYLACQNSLLNLDTLELLPPDPHYFNVNCLPFGYDPDAPKPKHFLRFLKQLWPDDEEARQTLQEIFGLMLTANTRYQKIFLLVGPKRAGKGTIARVLTALLGKDSVASPTLSSMAGEFGLQPLINKHIALISDARLGLRGDAHVVTERLLSISGEDTLTVNRKYRDAWTGKFAVRFVIMTNELPRISDASGALASRFVVLTLSESFYGREDLGLTEKLLTEMPGILNWALAGLSSLRIRGHFMKVPSSEEAIRDLENLASPVTAFVREWCEVKTGKRQYTDLLYSAYKLWCEMEGQNAASRAVFGRDLKAAFPQVAKRGRGKDKYYANIALNAHGRKKFEDAEKR